jgi:methylamine---glutamate N-methyltransferase subunit C
MKVPMTPENKAKCICMSCPTYTQNSLMGGVFCATDKSEKVAEMKGCNCPGCQVYADYDLKGGYFCIEGAAE